MNSTLPKRDLVLVGAGHTNSHVLRMWRMKPLPDVRLTCVSPFSRATYSGMLPGVLAGLYPPERMTIDLVRLCAASGIRFVNARATGLDLARRELLVEDRPPIPFDVLSIGIGSVPRDEPLRSSEQGADRALVVIKPMQTFLARLDRRLEALRERAEKRPLRIAVVGAGAGGVEITFCLPNRVREKVTDRFELTLIDRNDDVLPGGETKTARLARRELQARGVTLLLGHGVRQLLDGRLTLEDGRELEFDLILWATSARGPASLESFGLPTDDDGFLLTRPTLQTVADAPVFAVGDAGTIREYPTPKAGVYAVRQGPVLWENAQRMLRGEALIEYVPQSGFLSLMATGDRRAILSYKGFSAHASWCWRLKDYIDSRFMDKHQDYRPMSMTVPPADPAAAMRCAGCGGKVGGSILSRVLDRLDVPQTENVIVGLDAPDDAAVVQIPGGRPVVATVDFFAAFLDDPYLVGRVAALNAASDLFAVGSRPLAAMALATLPVGPPRQQEQLLYELLAGSLREFRSMGAALVGGHTIEGPQTALGFSMLADPGDAPPRLKGGLRAGDQLVLTKPLGAGVLLAAHMQARCRAEWMDALLPVLLASNQAAAALADEFDIQGMTDITGFGLAGHTLEMLDASNVAAKLHLDRVPLLPGAAELASEGLESTLAPANRTAEEDIAVAEAQRRTAVYQLLFDPQTSGGLLLGVPQRHLAPLLHRLAEIGPVPPAHVGEVVEDRSDEPRLRLA